MSDDIGSYVRSGEKLLWKGRPQQGLRFVAFDIFLVPFSLLWGGGVATMLLGGFAEAGLSFTLFSLIFLFAAAYITVGRLVHDAWIRSNTQYALTDKRVLILAGGFSQNLTSLSLEQIDQITFRNKGDRGDIVFGRERSLLSFFGTRSMRSAFAIWTPSLSDVPQFIGVERARSLYDQIEGLRSPDRRYG